MGIRRIVKAIREWWIGDIQLGVGYQMMANNKTSKLWELRYTLDEIFGFSRWGVGRLICRWKGHDMVDNGGWCNPDSGGEVFTCKRCGYTQEIIYY